MCQFIHSPVHNHHHSNLHNLTGFLNVQIINFDHYDHFASLNRLYLHIQHPHHNH